MKQPGVVHTTSVRNFFGGEGRFGSITRSAKLYSTTVFLRPAFQALGVIRAEEGVGDKVGIWGRDHPPFFGLESEGAEKYLEPRTDSVSFLAQGKTFNPISSAASRRRLSVATNSISPARMADAR